jgi:hypothetical protein
MIALVDEVPEMLAEVLLNGLLLKDELLNELLPDACGLKLLTCGQGRLLSRHEETARFLSVAA